MTKKYLCIGGYFSYGTIVVGEGDTLTDAYECYTEACGNFGGEPNEAAHCKFYPAADVAALALNVEVRTSIKEKNGG